MKSEFLFREEHLEAFQTMAQCGVWRDRKVSPWTQSVGIADVGNEARSQPLSRSFLKQLCATEAVSDRDVLWSILAWGGMRIDAGRRLARHESRWIEIIGKIRRGGFDRLQSYRICFDAVQEIISGGIGPAYFTKLIFFANPKHDGYIMDQWTSRSINFLVDGPPIIKMRTQNHVDPRNDDVAYEQFCRAVEALSNILTHKTFEETELCLFSKGGRSPHPWRRYLLKNGG
jgi:hypothetical protein